MKAGVLVIAAAIASGVSGKGHAARRHAHEAFHMERGLLTTAPASEATCGCTTIYTTITGEGTLYFPPPPPPTSTPAPPPPPPSSTSTPKPVVPSTSPAAVVPTPLATTCPTPGVYTIPATTITLTESTTVCAATSTSVPSGVHTVGGVTTVVTTATTVVCPYATVSTSEGVVTSVIKTTTYVCPAAGTYTVVPPLTTSCSTSSIWVYPTPASYAPGTYTQPEVVTTITETDYVIFCPFTSPAPPAPVATYAAPPPPAPKPTKAAPPPPKAPAKAPAKAPSSSGLGTSGDQWAITYTPYDNTGHCKDSASVTADINLIKSKGFTTVRTYSTDCSTLENVGGACIAAGLKIILGVFISDTGISGAQQQVTDIVSWASGAEGRWDSVELIVIGNEAVFNTYCSAGELAQFISTCKSTFASSGYKGPCTTTEPLDIWQASTAELCAVVDVVGCNIHPFFNPTVTAEEAGTFVSGQMDIVEALCSGKSGINLETGWPSAGSCNGAACPGKSQQATAVASIKAAVGGKSVLFSFTNDEWKPAGAFDCEQSWGTIDLF